MSHSSPFSENLGYLTVIDQPKLGLIGGFLVLNPAGRPLEFHCTTPIKPNRAQEILYGSTLEPFLFGEQIAKTLIARSKVPVAYVLTDVAPALAVQDFVEIPVLYVFALRPPQMPSLSQEGIQDEKAEDRQPVIAITEAVSETLKSFGIENDGVQRQTRIETGPLQVPEVPGLDVSRWQGVQVGNRRIALPGREDDEWNQLVDRIKAIALTIDLAEPFTRIRLAIEEAQRAA